MILGHITRVSKLAFNRTEFKIFALDEAHEEKLYYERDYQSMVRELSKRHYIFVRYENLVCRGTMPVSCVLLITNSLLC